MAWWGTMTAIKIDVGILHCRFCDTYCDELPNRSEDDTMIAILDHKNEVIEYLHPICHERILRRLKT